MAPNPELFWPVECGTSHGASLAREERLIWEESNPALKQAGAWLGSSISLSALVLQTKTGKDILSFTNKCTFLWLKSWGSGLFLASKGAIFYKLSAQEAEPREPQPGLRQRPGPSRPLTAPAPHGPTRPRTAPHGPTRPHMAPHGPARPRTALHGPAWPHTALHGPRRPRMAPHGPARPRPLTAPAPHGPTGTRPARTGAQLPHGTHPLRQSGNFPE